MSEYSDDLVLVHCRAGKDKRIREMGGVILFFLTHKSTVTEILRVKELYGLGTCLVKIPCSFIQNPTGENIQTGGQKGWMCKGDQPSRM